MAEAYKALLKGGEGEIVEKKSRFIATTMPVKSEAEALAFIEAMKKKYWDARHNCSAFVIGRNHELKRCSDDGEPSQTAGKPMLEVLLGEDIHNIAVVVTRYFGGTLLGTGGLVRAYTAAVKEGLAGSVIVTKQPGVRLRIRTDYNGVGKLQYICGQMEIPILDTQYTDIVEAELLVPEMLQGALEKKVTEATNGKAIISNEGAVWYGEVEKEITIFDD
ncbi:MAG: YigZ family protein [Lachnospiraceae bacterium]|nr:YigZ family protein [Lachnospiraceae bacterium]